MWRGRVFLGCVAAVGLVGTQTAVAQRAPVSANPAPAARPPAAAAGTILNTILETPLDVMRNQSGDAFSLVVTVPVRVDGEVVIPAGSFLQGRVGYIHRATIESGTSEMEMILETAELPGREARGLIASVDAVGAADTHLLAPRSVVTGIRYGPRRAAWIGAAIGGAFGLKLGSGESVQRGKSMVGAGLLGALIGYLAGRELEPPHDPSLRLPYGTVIRVRLNAPLP
ncbi:MAG TPA: hypothetical protein VN515_02865 [Terriglobales bacterium]|nr:hypothetical protein [Terriglobales bacterium]